MKKSDPPIDWMKAVVLERINEFGFTQQQLSALSGISVPVVRNCMRNPVASWNPKYRKNIFKALHIKITDFPEVIQLNAIKDIDNYNCAV